MSDRIAPPLPLDEPWRDNAPPDGPVENAWRIDDRYGTIRVVPIRVVRDPVGPFAWEVPGGERLTLLAPPIGAIHFDERSALEQAAATSALRARSTTGAALGFRARLAALGAPEPPPPPPWGALGTVEAVALAAAIIGDTGLPVEVVVGGDGRCGLGVGDPLADRAEAILPDRASCVAWAAERGLARLAAAAARHHPDPAADDAIERLQVEANRLLNALIDAVDARLGLEGHPAGDGGTRDPRRALASREVAGMLGSWREEDARRPFVAGRDEGGRWRR